MVESSGVPLPIVDKLVDTIKEFNKQVSDSTIAVSECSKDISMLMDVTKTIGDRISTPPRHEELHAKLIEANTNLESISKNQINLNTLIKSVVREIRVYFIALTLASLVAGSIIGYFRYSDDSATISQQQREIMELKESMEKLHKDGILKK